METAEALKEARRSAELFKSYYVVWKLYFHFVLFFFRLRLNRTM